MFSGHLFGAAGGGAWAPPVRGVQIRCQWPILGWHFSEISMSSGYVGLLDGTRIHCLFSAFHIARSWRKPISREDRRPGA